MRPTRLAPVIVLVAVLVALLGLGQVGQPSGKDGVIRRSSTDVPVEGVTLVCPPSLHQTSLTSTRTVVGTGLPNGGDVSVEPLDRKTPTQRPLLATAPIAVIGTLIEQSIVLRGTGPQAAGLVALRTTLSAEAKTRGLEADRCVTPRTQWWFSGASTALNVQSVLHLSNADDSPASVNVTGIGPKGLIFSPNTQGRLLPPHSGTDIRLEELAGASTDPFTVQVVATRGRVAASITETRSPIPAPQGLDSIPSQDFPRPSVVIPAVPGRTDSTVLKGSKNVQTLYVTVPGTQDATVHVEATTVDGRFPVVIPELKGDSFTVGAQTQSAVQLDTTLTGGAVMLHVYADRYVPIVAGVAVTNTPASGDYRESVHLGPSSPVSGPAIVGDLRYESSVDSEIVVTSYSPRDTAVTFTGPGVIKKRFVIPATKAVIIHASDILKPGPNPSTALMTPDAGATNLYAGVLIEDLGFHGPLIAGYSVSGGVGSVTLPPSGGDPTLPLIDASEP